MDDTLEDVGVSAAPPVVAVMVIHDSGPWLEEALDALGNQDYPNLSVLLLDNNSETDPTPRVARVLPTAYVRRLTTNLGYGPACNEVLQVVEGASHFLFCHDDVAPDRDAIRLMVEEAFRSNAGVVSPKLVAWDDPRRLLQVGMTADKTGAVVDVVESGELDQEQHDGVRDVFVAPGPCMLVRADLFTSLRGFDPEITYAGEDLDLSWRAQVAGARVVVAPAARVRHLQAARQGVRLLPGSTAETSGAELEAMALRHSLLTMLKAYSAFHLLRVLPQAIITSVVRSIAAVITGRRDAALAVWRAWRWNLGRLGALRQQRREVRGLRSLGDSEVRRLQSRGSAGLISFARGHHLVGEDSTELRVVEAVRTTLARLRPDGPTSALVIMALLVLIGSRGLITGALPSTGELAPFPSGALGTLRQFISGWNPSGLGSETPRAPAVGLLGTAGLLLLGSMAVLQRALVLGAIPMALVGAHRLGRPLGSRWSGAVAATVYAAVPLPWNALAHGRWSAIVAWAATPWILLRLARAAGLPPFSDGRARLSLADVVPLAILMALTAAVAPSFLVGIIVATVGLTIGLGLGGSSGTSRSLRLVLAAAGGAVVLLAPWSLQHLLALPPAPAAATVGQLLRFQTGPTGAPPFGWAFLVAALLPLILGRDWRARWAMGCWGMALATWLGAWCAGRGWLPLPGPHLDTVLAPAALALAVAAALGVRAFEVDLPDYHFGWRQLLSGLCMAAAVAGALPTVAASVDGRWHLRPVGVADQLSWMAEQRTEGEFRVLWLGQASALPLHGWRLGPRLAYATSDNGPPDAGALWSPAPAGATRLLGGAVVATQQGRVSSLGRMLAPFAVRYVVVVGGDTSRPDPALVPIGLSRALAAQSDLERIQTEPGLLVYENDRWAPVVSAVPGPVPGGAGDLTAAVRADISGAAGVLTRRGPVRFTGPVEPGAVLLAESSSPRWQLTVDGRRQSRRPTIGALNGWPVDRPGAATLEHRATPHLIAVLIGQVVVWAGLLTWLVRRQLERRRGRRAASIPLEGRLAPGFERLR